MTGPRTSSKGRVVMLTDNSVIGDSRVQKAARSMAEAGWEVHLLGREPVSGPWEAPDIGDAQVRLLKVEPHLAYLRYQNRRSVRRPLAYPPGKLFRYRRELLKARRADLVVRRALLTRRRAEGRRPVADAFEAVQILGGQVRTKVSGLWYRLRRREAARLSDIRQSPTRWSNRIPIWFWKTMLGERSWRRLDPALWQWELAFGEVIDELQPDVIHAHDFKLIGVGVRAAVRARAEGRPVKMIWDAHELVSGIMPRSSDPRWLPAQVEHVREFAPLADAVVTVSPALADLLYRQHHLRETPTVVLNAPPVSASVGEVPDLRKLCGIDRDVPLMVYGGGVNARRGLDLVVDALPFLPDVHVAFVTLHPNGANGPSESLLERAAELGVDSRVHLLPYVEHWQVSAFLSPADVGLIPIQHQPNHEIALITKFFEYSHARLPIVVSDVRTMSETVRATGQGEVFRADDVKDFVRAVGLVLADPDRYRSAYDDGDLLAGWTWEAQARVLDDLYTRLAPPTRRAEPR